MKILKETLPSMAAAKVTRGEKILARLADENLISEQGKDWLIAALDPFHDHQLKNLAGWPDVQTGASVVRLVKQSVTLQAAPGTAGNWDCHIVQWPWITSNQSPTSVGNFTFGPRNGNVITSGNLSAPGPNAKVGGLQAYQVTPGTPLSITLPNTDTKLISTLDMPQAYTRGVTRLIGMGFEVHNTTSQLNVQGSVLGYRLMANEAESNTWVLNDSTSYATFDGPFVRYPPRDAAEALLLSGSRQWEAKDGIYSVSTFHTTENPAKMIAPVSPVIIGADADDNEGSLAASDVNYAIPGPANANGWRGMTGFRTFNVHQNGAIFSGLSKETTLTLNWNALLETFPSPGEDEILPLATPSAEFDPDALDLYSRVITDIPVAVPVSENGLGDWFYDAAVTAAKYLGPVLSALPHPMLKGAGMAITGLSSQMQKGLKEDKKIKNSQAPPNSWGPPPRAQQSNVGWEQASGMRKAPKKRKPKRVPLNSQTGAIVPWKPQAPPRRGSRAR